MADLRIRTIADVSSGKAAIKELSAEEAKLLAQERAANAIRRKEAHALAREQIQLAKQRGNATRDEMESLRRVERIARADARQSAREAAIAQRETSRAAARQSRRELDLARMEFEDRARENRKLLGDGTDSRRRRRRGIGDDEDGPSLRSLVGGAAGKFLGPAAIGIILQQMLATLVTMLAEQRQARSEAVKGASDAGMAQNKLAEKLAESGMSTADITRVLAATEGIRGTKTTAELAQEALSAAGDGAGTADQLIAAMRGASAGGPEVTAQQRLANARARMRRENELAMMGYLPTVAGGVLDDEAASYERGIRNLQPRAPRLLGRLAGNVVGAFAGDRAALSAEDLVNAIANLTPAGLLTGGGRATSALDVRIVADQTTPRPLSED